MVGLLDTNALLAALGWPVVLSEKARELIRLREIVLSVVSYWEIVLKSRKGLILIPDPVTWWKRATDLIGVRVLSIGAEHVTAMVALPPLHKDPFDRILVAQAIAEGLILVTSDRQLLAYPVRTLW